MSDSFFFLKVADMSLAYRITAPQFHKFLIARALDNSLSSLTPVFPSDHPAFLVLLESHPPMDFHKSKGTISQSGVSCSWYYNGEREIFGIEITSMPFFITLDLVARGIQERINECL